MLIVALIWCFISQDRYCTFASISGGVWQLSTSEKLGVFIDFWGPRPQSHYLDKENRWSNIHMESTKLSVDGMHCMGICYSTHPRDRYQCESPVWNKWRRIHETRCGGFSPPTPAFLSSITLFFLGCAGYAGGAFRLPFSWEIFQWSSSSWHGFLLLELI